MKKLLSIALVLVFMLSLGTVAFAAEGDDPYEEYYIEFGDTVTFTKNLTANSPDEAEAEVAYPADTVSFTVSDGVVTMATEGTEAPELTIEAVTVNEGDTTATITVTVPEFPAVGVYTYTLTEDASESAGVTNLETDITLVFTVVQLDQLMVVAAVHCEAEPQTVTLDEDGNEVYDGDEKTKTDEFENVFDAGSLKLSKTVQGNMGDQEKEWNFTVTFEAPDGLTVNNEIVCTDEDLSIDAGWTGTKSVDVVLTHGQSVQFDNIPVGVSYTIVEAEAGEDDYETTVDGNEVGEDGVDGEIEEVELYEVEFVNEKNTTPDLGISLDSLPYIMIAVLAIAGLAVMLFRKHRYSED